MEAIEAESYYKPIRTIENGDLEAGFKQADHILEGEMHIGGQEHFYLETNVTLAVPKGEDGEMELFVSTQSTSKTQLLVAKALGVPANRVVVRVKRMGGGFGGKETRTTVLSTVVAVAANKGHPFYGKYKVGFLSSGKVVALDVSYYSNAGHSVDLSLSIMERALFHMENSYSVANVRGRGYVCRTNLPTNTAFRGFGGPQGMMVSENWITDVAQSLGRPAEEVRRLNLYVEGEATPYNQVLDQLTLDRCWDECLQRSRYQQRRDAAELFNRQNRWTKRGVAIVPTKFGISFTAAFLNQVASRVWVSRSKIHILRHTNTSPTPPTAPSLTPVLNPRLSRLASRTQNPKASWEDWVRAAYFDRVNLSANGFYKTPDLGYSFETNSGRVFNYFTYGVACSEVEIDCLTGAHKNLSTTIVMDVGHSLNLHRIGTGPCLGGFTQGNRVPLHVEGGFMQGLGLFTLEQLHYSPQGVLLTRGPGSYKIPSFGDIPTQLTVSLLRDAPHDKAIFASKAVGEPPLFLAASVFYAIKDAISAAREETGVFGPFRLDSPASAERIRTACQDRFTKLCPPADPGTYTPWSVQV
ncbi:hypothetical protein PFLUV_G00277450 [Perca fluviatilis]|uniref:Aldehyde oxidase/xanthine dehydrogenase a/b hammerhead domain-containing protein n=1 Tax=Perca fluviatilis TaxID=8168 RepID=A0A6A5ECJ0_PERFL|nr:hypothetical protein PFLUV_G00277450 [Perca fluviatilis]